MDGVTLSRDECLSFLERERVGRLGVSIDALPAIVPINYFLVGDTVVFRAAGQSKLFRGCNGSVLALEVDGYDPFAAIGWSVLAQGAAKEISDLEKLRSMRGHSQWPWAFDRHDRFLELQTSVLYGWRFVERT